MAIQGPARVFNGEVTSALTNCLLNEMGNDPDQLPLLQHALMRMWHLAQAEPADKITLTLTHYQQIGELANALSHHADEAYTELNPTQQTLAEILFRSLSERGHDNQDIRRPVKLATVAALANVSWEQIAVIVEVFRKEERSFLTPITGIFLQPDTILDITHESLIRQWRRLTIWAEQEAEAAALYRRLEDSACRWQEQQASLWRTPELEAALTWREKAKPTPQWASRYGKHFELAMRFLEESVKQQRRSSGTSEPVG
jgi:hypothetical protein